MNVGAMKKKRNLEIWREKDTSMENTGERLSHWSGNILEIRRQWKHQGGVVAQMILTGQPAH